MIALLFTSWQELEAVSFIGAAEVEKQLILGIFY